jgi:hypothetical protein
MFNSSKALTLTYQQKMQALNPRALWPLAESALNSTIFDQGASALHGTAQMGVLLTGNNRYYFHVGSIWGNIYSAGLNTKFNGHENGIIVRAKVRDVSTFWTDGLSHRCFVLAPDATNSTTIRKDAADPTHVTYRRWGNSVSSVVATDHSADANWMTLGISVSEAADQFKAFYNGAQDGATQTGLGVYAGALSSSQCVIGATDTTGGNVWDGWLGDLIVTLNGAVPTPTHMSTIHAKLAANSLVADDLDVCFGSGNWAWWTMTDIDVNDLSGHGVYGRGKSATLGVAGIGDGNTAMSFNGTSDYINIWSPGLVSAFNSLEGTLSAWVKPTWDATTRWAVNLSVNTTNYVSLAKTTTVGVITGLYVAGGTVKQVNFATGSPAGWLHIAVTWSKSADQVIFYVAGAPRGAIQTALGVWVGTIVDGGCQIGCRSIPFTSGFAGSVASASLFDSALPAASIAAMATVP